MKRIFFLVLALSFLTLSCNAQRPAKFRRGVAPKLIQPDTLSTVKRDALTPKLGTLVYHKDTGISRWEEWDGSVWEEFGSGGGANIFTSDGITPDASTRFFDLGASSNFYLRNSDYSNYIFFNNFNLELRNSQGGLRFRTGTGGTVTSNSVGDVWTATSTVGDGHWATPSGGGGSVEGITTSGTILGGDYIGTFGDPNGDSKIIINQGADTVTIGAGSPVVLSNGADVNNNQISNLGTPTVSHHAATKGYVDGNFVDLTSNQTKTGVLSFNNTSGVSTNGISIENSSATGTSYGLKVLNSNNSFDGQSGVLFENTGIGYAGITSIPSGNGGGHYILSNSTYTGTPLKYQKTGGNSFTVDANANVTANSFIGDGSGLTNLPNDFSEFMTSTGTRALSTLVTTIGDYDASGEGLFISIDQATPMIQLNGGVNLTGGAFNLFDAAENYATSFPTPVLTANRTLTMPDASGTIALTTDIPTTNIGNTRVGYGDGTGITGSLGFQYSNKTLSLGLHDNEQNTLKVYGDGAVLGGKIEIYNSGSYDAVDDYYTIAASGGRLSISGTSSGTILQYQTSDEVMRLGTYGSGTKSGTPAYSLAVDSSGNIIEEPLIIVSAPATATSTGITGQIAYDSSYFYVCTATNTWVRTALSTW